MTRQERLDVGEKIFVGVFVGSVVIEVLLTSFAVTFSSGWNTLVPWTILLLGGVFVGFLLYLANWLYSGDLTAWKTSLGWAAFQVTLSVAAIVAFLAGHGYAHYVAYVGLPVIWLAIIKAVTYAAFAGFLALPQPVRDFLGLRRGEATAHEPTHVHTEVAPVVEQPVTGPLPLTADQFAAFGTLATWMQAAAVLLIVAGLLRFYVGLLNIEADIDFKKWLPGLPAVIEGIAACLFGIYLLTPTSAMKLVPSSDVNGLLRTFNGLKSLYCFQVVLIAVAAVAVILGIAMSLGYI
jgi:hypothetical protein